MGVPTSVKNNDLNTGKVRDLLLYAKTDEAIVPDHNFSLSGNRISVKTLDLDENFSSIARQLDGLVEGIL